MNCGCDIKLLTVAIIQDTFSDSFNGFETDIATLLS